MKDIRDSADTPDHEVPAPGPAPEVPGKPGAPGTGAPGTAGIDLPALRRRTTAVLVASQILGGLGVSTGIALAAVLAEEISGSEGLSGLASTSSVLGTALLSLPLAALMSAKGRRAGLTLAYLIAAVGATVVVIAAAVGNFPLMLLGTAAFGAGSSANLQARFAAADLAEPGHRARAISSVVWATTIGAVLGPNIAAPAGRSAATLGLGIPPTAGPFLWAAVIFVIAGATVHLLLRPDPLLISREPAGGTSSATDGTDIPSPQEEPPSLRMAPSTKKAPSTRETRSLRAGLAVVADSARARLALVTIAGSHTVMVSIMVMTPIDLARHGGGIDLIGFVISVHVAGMYALSPVMGRLADHFGRLAVIGLGVALLTCAAALAGTAGPDHVRSAAGLFLLGLGWSACLVSGSALLTDSVPQDTRAAVQGLSDLTMNTCAAAGGALAGLIVSQAGYGWLTVLACTLLVPIVTLVAATVMRRRAGAEETGTAQRG